MGKKRNNAAKKKQGAKKKISATYGVSVLKGGTIARNNGVIETRTPMDAKTPVSKQTAKRNVAKLTQSNESTKSKEQRRSLSEMDEFARQHASLEERSLIRQSQKTQQRKKKKQKQGWGGNFASPSSMAPATLNLTKTTQQLVDDAANQITQMSDFGQRLAPSEGQSSLAAAAGSNWTAGVIAEKMEAQAQMKQAQLNSFAALNDDSESDNEWADSHPPAPQFQFQPASFAFQSSFIPVCPNENDVDPDL
jgi:hypothetical protein